MSNVDRMFIIINNNVNSGLNLYKRIEAINLNVKTSFQCHPEYIDTDFKNTHFTKAEFIYKTMLEDADSPSMPFFKINK